jgi:TPR repeat protein
VAQDEMRGYREALARGDYNAVVAELRPLADAGNAEAQCRLGILYAEGVGVRPNDALAASWLRRAADQGHGEAQYHLGRMYLAGRGVPDDRRGAIARLTKAAAAGYAPASQLLAKLRPDK